MQHNRYRINNVKSTRTIKLYADLFHWHSAYHHQWSSFYLPIKNKDYQQYDVIYHKIIPITIYSFSDILKQTIVKILGRFPFCFTHV